MLIAFGARRGIPDGVDLRGRPFRGGHPRPDPREPQSTGLTLAAILPPG